MSYMSVVGKYTHRRFQSGLSIAADRCHPLHHQIQPPVEKKMTVLYCFLKNPVFGKELINVLQAEYRPVFALQNKARKK